MTARIRARAMPTAERRDVILQATVPLLFEHGLDVSTKQIAEAAGVAEGTLFRVFADKKSLLHAAVERAFDPSPMVSQLHKINREIPLAERMVAAVAAMQKHLIKVFGLVGALRWDRPPNESDLRRYQAMRREHSAAITEALVALVGAPDGLRVSPEELALALRLFTYSATNPHMSDGRPLPAEKIVDIVLNGTRSLEHQ